MNKLTTWLRRCLILSKRLLRKPGLVAILLLIPLLVAAMGIASSSGDGSILTVALATEEPGDPTAEAILSDLSDGVGLVRFIRCDTPSAAAEWVESGRADAAWIFAGQMEQKIEKFTKNPNSANAFVTVIQREDNVLLRLAHEKLNATLYPHLSLALCGNYVYRHLLTPDDLSEQELEEYYRAVQAEGADLFTFAYLGSEDTAVDTSDANYLTSPLRGLLAIMVVLGGFAAAMFYMQDEKRGLFDRLLPKHRFPLALGYHGAAVFPIAVAMLLALLLTGMATSIGRELIALLLYSLITVGFCIALRLLCRDIRLLGALAPVLVVVMATMCPIFFKSPSLPVLQYLLPPYYYLNAIYKIEFIGYMAIYAVAIYGLDYALSRLRSR